MVDANLYLKEIDSIQEAQANAGLAPLPTTDADALDAIRAVLDRWRSDIPVSSPSHEAAPMSPPPTTRQDETRARVAQAEARAEIVRETAQAMLESRAELLELAPLDSLSWERELQ